jgi:hypothetical protein
MVTTYSERNLAIVLEAIETRNKTLPEESRCHCSPLDGLVKTFQGWKDSGRFVRKGEKSLCGVPTFINRAYDDKEGNRRFSKQPWKAFLFCFCQTDEIVWFSKANLS